MTNKQLREITLHYDGLYGATEPQIVTVQDGSGLLVIDINDKIRKGEAVLESQRISNDTGWEVALKITLR